MVARRIIPCLDIRDGRTVKGVNFASLRDAGDAVELAAAYSDSGADELVLLDVTATVEGRTAMYELVERVADVINIPFTVGGGVTTIEIARTLLHRGADKVSIQSAAVRNPELIAELAAEFGSQCVVVAIDTKWDGSRWQVYVAGGRIPTEIEAISFAEKAVELGAGELLVTSMNADGTKGGFACELMAELNLRVSVPTIASGGAGTIEHFIDVFRRGHADAALAASVFHFGELNILELKQALAEAGIEVRLT